SAKCVSSSTSRRISSRSTTSVWSCSAVRAPKSRLSTCIDPTSSCIVTSLAPFVSRYGPGHPARQRAAVSSRRACSAARHPVEALDLDGAAGGPDLPGHVLLFGVEVVLGVDEQPVGLLVHVAAELLQDPRALLGIERAPALLDQAVELIV